MQLIFTRLSNKIKKNYIKIILILMVILIIISNFQNYNLRKQLSYYQSKYKIQYENILKKYIFPKLKDSNQYDLIIIFSPEDCPFCLEEITFLNNLTKRKSNIKTWGLVDHPYPELVKKFLKSIHWDFSCTFINNNSCCNNFGLNETPIKILLKDKQIIFIEEALSNWKKEGKIKSYILSLNNY